MRYHARIIDGHLATVGALCDMVHLDVVGDLMDRAATIRLVLSTSIGERFVDLCGSHDSAVGADLARWSHPVDAAQSGLESSIDGMLTNVLSQTLNRA